MTLTEFLLARIVEDEVSAGDHYACHEDGADVVGAPCAEGDGAHPCKARTRLLAECEAKRRIVASYESDDNSDRWASCGDQCEWHALGYAMRALALPYASHPDYREEWKP